MLLAESPTTPMHVASFNVLSLPPRARADFVARLVDRLRRQPINNPPWNYRLAQQSLLASKLAPAWEIVPDEDVNDHIFHHALPAPGGERALGELLQRLHSQPLDMSRPLWEFHAIEGYGNRRFVIYTKMHHAMFDGTTSQRATVGPFLSESPATPARGPWTVRTETGKTGRQPERPRDREASFLSRFQERVGKRLDTYRSLPGFVQAMRRTLDAAIGGDSALVAPYMCPKSIVNGPLTSRRRFATHAFDLARVKAVAKASESTLNDVLLAVCGGALRRYLEELEALPDGALTAGIPVALKHEEGARSGNRVSALFATLATDVDDPLERLMAVKRSMQAGKEHVLAMSEPGLDLYSSAMIVPAMIAMLTGTVMTNVAISNVPGPRSRLFFAGAPMEACYPISVLAPLQALNITCVSYDSGLYLGLVSCPDVLPHVQHLAVYTGDAFKELEAAVKRHASSKVPAARRRARLKERAASA